MWNMISSVRCNIMGCHIPLTYQTTPPQRSIISILDRVPTTGLHISYPIVWSIHHRSTRPVVYHVLHTSKIHQIITGPVKRKYFSGVTSHSLTSAGNGLIKYCSGCLRYNNCLWSRIITITDNTPTMGKQAHPS